MHIAVDAMGGDHAPAEIVRGAVAALQAKDDLNITLVGRERAVREALQGLHFNRERLGIVHTAEVIQGEDDPGLAIRNKKRASMVVALQMVREGRAAAALSAGNTGALMAGGLLFLGRLENISRPALLTVMPSFSGVPVVVLDVGANMDARPEQMVQYAFMGRVYAQQLLGRAAPRIALLNVGTESNKGNSQVKKAYSLFRAYVPGFCGNIEGTDIFFNAADVVVCDGFVGNILLKISEGLARGILGYFKQELKRTARFRLGASLLLPVLQGLRENIDDSEYGGAPLVGVKGICIKCHGSARSRSIEQALIKQVYPLVRNNVPDLFREALREVADLMKGAETT